MSSLYEGRLISGYSKVDILAERVTITDIYIFSSLMGT